MPVITSPWYTAELLDEHLDWLFLFGDNNRRTGLKGQAAICRGRGNCLGIRTKWLPNMRPAAFFTDNDYERCTKMIGDDLALALDRVLARGTVVLPLGGLGTGLSELENRAPRLFRFLHLRLQYLVREAADQELPPPLKITAPKAWEMQRTMRHAHIAMIWTVYKGTDEFPKDYVAVPSSSACLAAMREVLVDHSLKHLRERMPGGMQIIPPMPEDGSTVVETWV